MKRLHQFSFPKVEGWAPATIEDARAIGCDLAMTGSAYATEDGHRVDPLTVQIRDGVAYGGDVRTHNTDADGAVHFPTKMTIEYRAKWWKRPVLRLLGKPVSRATHLKDVVLTNIEINADGEITSHYRGIRETEQ